MICDLCPIKTIWINHSASNCFSNKKNYLKEMWVDIGMNDINDQQVIHDI